MCVAHAVSPIQRVAAADCAAASRTHDWLHLISNQDEGGHHATREAPIWHRPRTTQLFIMLLSTTMLWRPAPTMPVPVARGGPAVLQEGRMEGVPDPYAKRGFGVIVPNPMLDGQTSGISWYQPGEAAVFDPLGLLTSAEKFERLRYVEVKHGRIAMLAVLGHVAVAAGARWPGPASAGVSFSSISGSGFKALSQLGPADIAVSVLFIGFLEIRVMKEIVKGEFPGDLRNGLFKDGWDAFSETTKKEKINKELNNGRAAMMGILALMVHEGLDGKPYVLNEMLGLGQPY